VTWIRKALKNTVALRKKDLPNVIAVGIAWGASPPATSPAAPATSFVRTQPGWRRRGAMVVWPRRTCLTLQKGATWTRRTATACSDANMGIHGSVHDWHDAPIDQMNNGLNALENCKYVSLLPLQLCCGQARTVEAWFDVRRASAAGLSRIPTTARQNK
jgi:hypothetical protein